MNCSALSVEASLPNRVEDTPFQILARIVAREILKNRRNQHEPDRQAIQTNPAQG